MGRNNEWGNTPLPLEMGQKTFLGPNLKTSPVNEGMAQSDVWGHRALPKAEEDQEKREPYIHNTIIASTKELELAIYY